MAATELDSGAGNQVLDGGEDQHLSGLCIRRDAGADVDRDSNDLPLDELALTGVQADPQLEPELTHRLGDCTTATNPACGPVEEGEEAIPGRIQSLPR